MRGGGLLSPVYRICEDFMTLRNEKNADIWQCFQMHDMEFNISNRWHASPQPMMTRFTDAYMRHRPPMCNIGEHGCLQYNSVSVYPASDSQYN